MLNDELIPLVSHAWECIACRRVTGSCGVFARVWLEYMVSMLSLTHASYASYSNSRNTVCSSFPDVVKKCDFIYSFILSGK